MSKESIAKAEIPSLTNYMDRQESEIASYDDVLTHLEEIADDLDPEPNMEEDAAPKGTPAPTSVLAKMDLLCESLFSKNHRLRQVTNRIRRAISG